MVFHPNQPPIILNGKPYYYNFALEPTPCPKCGEFFFMAFQLLQVLEDGPKLVVGERERTALLNEKSCYICLWCLHREIRQPADEGGSFDGGMKVTNESDIDWAKYEVGNPPKPKEGGA